MVKRRATVSPEFEGVYRAREVSAGALSPVKTVPLKKKQPLAQGYVPGFKILKQGENNWCWAAVTQSVRKVLDGIVIRQCQIIEVTRHPDRPNCCDDHSSCDEAFYTSRALDKFKNLRQFVNTPLGLGRIKGEIPEGFSSSARPIGCGVSDGGRGGHAVVIFGWQKFTDKVRLHIGDPKAGENATEWLGPFSQPPGKRWVETYRTKKASE